MPDIFKPERTPLLGPGYHTMTLPKLKILAVENFEASHARIDLFRKFESFVHTLEEALIPCDLWIDGSFLTEEHEPSDIDIAVKVMDDVMMSLDTNQDRLLTNISADDEAYLDGLDTFVFSGYWRGHRHYGTDVDDGYSHSVPTWGDQFGKGRDDWLKGIAIVPILETDLGFSIRT